jgi:hypothetical protein
MIRHDSVNDSNDSHDSDDSAAITFARLRFTIAWPTHSSDILSRRRSFRMRGRFRGTGHLGALFIRAKTRMQRRIFVGTVVIAIFTVVLAGIALISYLRS